MKNDSYIFDDTEQRNYLTKKIADMAPFVDKLVGLLNEVHNISFQTKDGDLENVVFSKEGFNDLKIAYRCFYRISGMCKIMKDTKHKDRVIWVDVTDDMFINNYMCSIILLHFEN